MRERDGKVTERVGKARERVGKVGGELVRWGRVGKVGESW